MERCLVFMIDLFIYNVHPYIVGAGFKLQLTVILACAHWHNDKARWND